MRKWLRKGFSTIVYYKNSIGNWSKETGNRKRKPELGNRKQGNGNSHNEFENS
jgi:hypothetical protein